MVEALKVNGAKIKYREGKGSLSCIGRGKINLTVTIFSQYISPIAVCHGPSSPHPDP
jgi:5-enolpyruvylshikimate-3-phosphate synthase